VAVSFEHLAQVSRDLAAARGRLAKRETWCRALASCEPDEVARVVAWLAGEVTVEGLGPAKVSSWARLAPAVDPAPCSLERVDGALGDLDTLQALVCGMHPEARAFFARAVIGNLRQGSAEGLALDALAAYYDVDLDHVTRARAVMGSVSRLAGCLARGEALPTALTVGAPLEVMLATSAADVAETAVGIEDCVLEWKVDGVRAQVHRRGGVVSVFSRAGKLLGEGVRAWLASSVWLTDADFVIDAELVVNDPQGRPLSFQETFAALSGPNLDGRAARLLAFDCMHHAEKDLRDQPLVERRAVLAKIVPAAWHMPSCVICASAADARAKAQSFFSEACAAGHEGVMVKRVQSTYRAGDRGKDWYKVKHVDTVDLVVLAAEWGSGRRTGWLSNLHLGARASDGTLVMVGKTFKGLTDIMLTWQTERLRALMVSQSSHVVHVRPELVVEVAFNDVQWSPRYPGKVALRFARVVRHRPDKNPAVPGAVESLERLQARLPESLRGRLSPKVDRQLRLF
jgi:DNA ligase-1